MQIQLIPVHVGLERVSFYEIQHFCKGRPGMLTDDDVEACRTFLAASDEFDGKLIFLCGKVVRGNPFNGYRYLVKLDGQWEVHVFTELFEVNYNLILVAQAK